MNLKPLRRLLFVSAIGVFLFCFALARPAYAYLDPGSGSYIFQLLLGGVLGAFFMVKVYLKQIKTFFLSWFQKKPKA